MVKNLPASAGDSGSIPRSRRFLLGGEGNGNHDAGRDWGQEEKGTTEDEMAGWHHRLEWT